jgi:nucleoside 2-deoxyribosyltransferase
LKEETQALPAHEFEGMTMRVYLSGPMKGYPESNFPAFHAKAAALRSKGLEVVNPAEINVKGAGNDADFYNQCLRADLKAMMDCDAIALMRGWEASNGANLELHVAHRVGMRVLFVDELLTPHL